MELLDWMKPVAFGMPIGWSCNPPSPQIDSLTCPQNYAEFPLNHKLQRRFRFLSASNLKSDRLRCTVESHATFRGTSKHRPEAIRAVGFAATESLSAALESHAPRRAVRRSGCLLENKNNLDQFG